jgi:hypothetical protein
MKAYGAVGSALHLDEQPVFGVDNPTDKRAPRVEEGAMIVASHPPLQVGDQL